MEKKLPLARNTSAQSDAVQLSATAQFARDRAGERDRSRTCQRGEESNGKKRIAKQYSTQPNEQRRQRWKIDITKCKMLSASDIVELVTKIIVLTVCEKMKEQSRAAQAGDHCPLAREPGSSRYWHAWHHITSANTRG
jgi:hypothetical protein